MIEAVVRALLAQTITLSLAVVAVRGLQAPVARWLGAGAAYLAWLLVPVAMVAIALPHPANDALVVHVDVAAMAPAWVAAPTAARPAPLAPVLAAGWAAGMALLALVLWRRQRGFEALVSPRIDGEACRLPRGSGPAVLGVLRPRIVLPRDFESAFDAEERRLMLLHERVHLRRADNAWNLLASALLVAHWFNPIAWWAWRRLRADQEMACDAAVLRAESPAALATYAGALLKAQGVALAPPFASAWQSTHPLVERVRMLKTHRISAARHRAGLHLATLAVVLAGCGGYALQAGASGTPAEAKDTVITGVDVRVDAHPVIAARLMTLPGQAATLRVDPDAKRALKTPVEIDYTVTRLDGDRLQLDATLRAGAPLATLGAPRLVTRDGMAVDVSVRTSDGAHEVAVSFRPKMVNGAPPVPVPALPPTPALASLPPVPGTDALPPLPAPPAPASLPSPPPPQRSS